MVHIQKKIFILLIFFVGISLRLINIDYGLPNFVNSDEISFLTSTNYYYSFLDKNIYRNLIDPFVSPLLTFLLTSFFLTLKLIFNHSFILAELKNEIETNPWIMIFLGRLSSTIFNILSIYFINHCLKIFNLKFFLRALILMVLFTSYSNILVSQTNGKFAIVTFLYSLQFYQFLKIYIKKKNSFKNIFLLIVITSFGFGTNYYCSIVGLMGLFLIFLEENKKLRLKIIYIFTTLFSLIAIIPTLVLNVSPFDKYLNNPEMREQYYGDRNFFEAFFFDVKEIANSIIQFEPYVFLIALLTILFIFKKKDNANYDYKIIILFFLSILIPIFLISIADHVKSAIRYGSIYVSSISLLLGYILSKDQSFQRLIKFVLIFCIAFNFMIYFLLQTALSKDDSRHIFFQKYKNFVYDGKIGFYKLNKLDLTFKKILFEKEIIFSPKEVLGKNNKKQILKKLSKFNDDKNKVDKRIFLDGAVGIEDIKQFRLLLIELTKLPVSYYGIEYSKDDIQLEKIKILQSEYELIDIINDNFKVYEHKREILDFNDLIEIKRMGSKILIFRIKKS